MRRQSKVRSTSYVSATSTSDLTGRCSASSRKVSQICSDLLNSSCKDNKDLIDDAHLQGKIKVSSSIKNPDRCVSVTYRPNDGRFYAVGLANGTINVYSSKTDNILYTLNNDSEDLPFSDVGTTCVRFRPCSMLQSEQPEVTLQYKPIKNKSLVTQHSAATGGGGNHSTYSGGTLLPPINDFSRASFSRRRKSSHSALGFNLNLGISSNSTDACSPANLVSAAFTTGSVKTFNFLTEQCLREVKENRDILTMEYSKTGNMLATGGENGNIQIYDAETGTLQSSYEPKFDYDKKLLRTYAIAFHPQSESELISGGWNKEILFHDVRVPNIFVSKVSGPKICGESLAFHPSGKEFCGASWAKNDGLHIFDYTMKRPIDIIYGASGKRESVSDTFSKSTLTRSKVEHNFPSSFLHSARYFMGNARFPAAIAVGGCFPGSVAIIECNSEKNLLLASISNMPRSVFSVDTFKTKVTFTLGDEVCCCDIFI